MQTNTYLDIKQIYNHMNATWNQMKMMQMQHKIIITYFNDTLPNSARK